MATNKRSFRLLDNVNQSIQESNFKQIRISTPNSAPYLVWGLIDPDFQSLTKDSNKCDSCQKGPLRCPNFQNPDTHTCGRTDFEEN